MVDYAFLISWGFMSLAGTILVVFIFTHMDLVNHKNIKLKWYWIFFIPLLPILIPLIETRILIGRTIGLVHSKLGGRRV